MDSLAYLHLLHCFHCKTYFKSKWQKSWINNVTQPIFLQETARKVSRFHSAVFMYQRTCSPQKQLSINWDWPEVSRLIWAGGWRAITYDLRVLETSFYLGSSPWTNPPIWSETHTHTHKVIGNDSTFFFSFGFQMTMNLRQRINQWTTKFSIMLNLREEKVSIKIHPTELKQTMFNVKKYLSLFKVSPGENRAKFILWLIKCFIILRSCPRYEFGSHSPRFKISQHQKKICAF